MTSPTIPAHKIMPPKNEAVSNLPEAFLFASTFVSSFLVSEEPPAPSERLEFDSKPWGRTEVVCTLGASVALELGTVVVGGCEATVCVLLL